MAVVNVDEHGNITAEGTGTLSFIELYRALSDHADSEVDKFIPLPAATPVTYYWRSYHSFGMNAEGVWYTNPPTCYHPDGSSFALDRMLFCPSCDRVRSPKDKHGKVLVRPLP